MMFSKFVSLIDQVILWYFLGLNSFYVFLLILSVPEIVRRFREVGIEEAPVFKTSGFLPPISILCPAYNEENSIITSISAMLNLNYPSYEVVVINDGSTDSTLYQLIMAFDLVPVPPAFPTGIKTKSIRQFYQSLKDPRLLVVDKENGGKADSLNAGINTCRSPLFLACDADTIIEKDALSRMARPLLTTKGTIATGGTIRVVNDCIVENGEVIDVRFPSGFLPAVQAVEYLRAYLFGRMGWNRLGGNLVISGAFGLFDRQAVIESGGYRTDTVGEDMELVVRLYRDRLPHSKKRCSVSFIPDPVAWTEVPSNLRVLSRQRERWHRGLIQTLTHHHKMMLNPQFKLTGLIAFPFFAFGEMLAPIVEVIGLAGFITGLFIGAVDLKLFMLFISAAWGLSIILTAYSILLEEATFRRYKHPFDKWKMLAFAIFENLGYRQLTVYWRLKGFWHFLRGNQSWGKMERTGFKKAG